MTDAPWLDRATELVGLYEFPGEEDNEAIIAMTMECGGKIARTYKHDSIPWCALFVNYCLVNQGFEGNDSLWALDFRKYGIKLETPVVGAIATFKRTGGGHVGFVIGKTRDGRIVIRGGNQSDMVCDAAFPAKGIQYNWPEGVEVPKAPLPIIKSIIRSKRPITLAVLTGNESTMTAFGDIPETDPYKPAGWRLVTARTAGIGTAAVTGASATVSAVTGVAQKTVEQVEIVKDATGNVIEISGHVQNVAPQGFFSKLVAMFITPEFLSVALFVVCVAWFMSWYFTKDRTT